MYLFEKEDKNINIYNMCPKLRKLYCYKKKIMESITDSEKVLYAQELLKNGEELPLFEYYKDDLDNRVIPKNKVYSKYNDDYRNHELHTSNKSSYYKNELLDRYYNREFKNNKVVKVSDNKELRYFLLTKNNYENDVNNKLLKYMEDIIEIPEKLYLLHMIEQYKFNLIDNFDIKEQLELFNLSFIDKISIDELRRLDWFGMTNNSYEKSLKLAENDEKVLKLIRNK